VRKIAYTVLICFIFSAFMISTSASETGYTTAALNVRTGAGTSYSKVVTLPSGSAVTIEATVSTSDNSTDCKSGKWYKINNGYICTDYVTTSDAYDRPWTTPKKSIVGGAKYISKNYIAKGQYTSYLKRFNVNPNGSYDVYTHQYMTNLLAVYSEARTSYTSYYINGLLNQPLVFTIPIFENMPENTDFGDYKNNIEEQKEITDEEFEKKLDEQGFSESYKAKLRAIHSKYSNWTFESMKTGLDWEKSVKEEQPNSYVNQDLSNLAYKDSNGSYVLKEGSTWYLANSNAVAYYMDPRNFLNAERILMFEKLSYSEIYTEAVVQTILNSTFMSGKSTLDNQNYSSIFVEAGKTADVSAVYLASLAKQEVGVDGSITTSGEQFTYDGVTYKGLYNFYNIGAYSSVPEPAKAGLVFANGSSTSTIVGGTVETDKPEYEEPKTEETTTTTTNKTEENDKQDKPKDEENKSDEDSKKPISIEKLQLIIKDNYAIVSSSMTLESLQKKDTSLNIVIYKGEEKIKSSDKIGTGYKLVISDEITYDLVVSGDLTGDGEINSADLLRMRQHMLGKNNLKDLYLKASDLSNNDEKINSADLLRLRQYLLGKISNF